MKRTLKILTSLCMAVLLLCGMVLPSLAASYQNGSTGKVTVSGVWTFHSGWQLGETSSTSSGGNRGNHYNNRLYWYEGTCSGRWTGRLMWTGPQRRSWSCRWRIPNPYWSASRTQSCCEFFPKKKKENIFHKAVLLLFADSSSPDIAHALPFCGHKNK